MSNEDFSGPSLFEITADAFAVAMSTGLAFIPDEKVGELTAGVMKAPAAVLVADIVSARGVAPIQLLLSRGALASLHGSLRAWAKRLPVDARDQYDALAAESEQIFTARAAEYLDGDR